MDKTQFDQWASKVASYAQAQALEQFLGMKLAEVPMAAAAEAVHPLINMERVMGAPGGMVQAMGEGAKAFHGAGGLGHAAILGTLGLGAYGAKTLYDQGKQQYQQMMPQQMMYPSAGY